MQIYFTNSVFYLNRKLLQEMSSSLTLMGNDITLSLEALQEKLKTYKEESQLEDKFFASVAIILTFFTITAKGIKTVFL